MSAALSAGDHTAEDTVEAPAALAALHTLPAQPTPLIGRDEVLAAAGALLAREDVRLLTLTGTAGTGKTRLAVHLAQTAARAFPEGVCFVDLAPLTAPDRVPAAIVGALRIRDEGNRPLRAALVDTLRARRILLVLDNFEHVLPAAADVADLLAACRHLRVLATSRVALHLRWEHEFPVPPLAAPGGETLPPLPELLSVPAVALFVARARAAQPDFVVVDADAAALAELCTRLDGLPLAIELAAARIKVLPVRALLARLQHRLDLLVGGAHDLPARQHTLRAAIGWSYDLLAAGEQALFRRFGVFVGGATLDAAGSLVPEDDVVAGLTALVEHNLVRQAPQPDGEPRFTMLETLREYALERLRHAGEEAAARVAHFAYCLSLAEAAALRLTTGGRNEWLARLAREHENLRAALEYGLATGRTAETLRLATALWWFWYFRGHLAEGRRWLEAAIERSATEGADAALAALRAAALCAAGALAFYLGDGQAALDDLEQAAALAGQTGDTRSLAYARMFAGLAAQDRGETERARTLLEESLAPFCAAGDEWGLALALCFRARPLRQLGDLDRGDTSLEESAARFRALDDPWGLALALNSLGNYALQRGDRGQARTRYEAALQLRRAAGDRWFVAHSLTSLGELTRRTGDIEQALRYLVEALALFRDLGSTRMFAVCLAELAQLTAARGQTARAVTLFAAVQSLCDAVGAVLDPTDQAEYERCLAEVRSAVDAEAFAQAWAAGRALSLADILASAREEIVPPPAAASPAAAQPSPGAGGETAGVAGVAGADGMAGLTPREREVAALLAEGLTNRQIAARLVISEQTAETHVKRILSKLGAATRTQVAARVVAARLVASPATTPAASR